MKVKINGAIYSFFTDIEISYNLDSMASVFSFKSRFNPDNKLHREVFQPLAFHKVEIFSNDDVLLLTGVLVNTSLSSSSARSLQTLQGYSKAGILEDCTIPVNSYPLEKTKVSLSDLASSLLKDFNIGFSIDASAKNEMNSVYEKTVAQPAETVKAFLSKLAAQRNIIISHDSRGDLVFFKLDTKRKPIMLLDERNTLKMALNVSGQAFHSEISVIRQPSKDNTSLNPVDTVINSMVKIKRSVTKCFKPMIKL